MLLPHIKPDHESAADAEDDRADEHAALVRLKDVQQRLAVQGADRGDDRVADGAGGADRDQEVTQRIIQGAGTD